MGVAERAMTARGRAPDEGRPPRPRRTIVHRRPKEPGEAARVHACPEDGEDRGEEGGGHGHGESGHREASDGHAPDLGQRHEQEREKAQGHGGAGKGDRAAGVACRLGGGLARRSALGGAPRGSG